MGHGVGGAGGAAARAGRDGDNVAVQRELRGDGAGSGNVASGVAVLPCPRGRAAAAADGLRGVARAGRGSAGRGCAHGRRVGRAGDGAARARAGGDGGGDGRKRRDGERTRHARDVVAVLGGVDARDARRVRAGGAVVGLHAGCAQQAGVGRGRGVGYAQAGGGGAVEGLGAAGGGGGERGCEEVAQQWIGTAFVDAPDGAGAACVVHGPARSGEGGELLHLRRGLSHGPRAARAGALAGGLRVPKAADHTGTHAHIADQTAQKAGARDGAGGIAAGDDGVVHQAAHQSAGM
ncbi:hypothetical protein SDC9_149465 [bioreactor metagenome]|uniref:Uncharacterized protein n=1 Tax=bioreactor metagenome TaxID=1076179 RepID=A0A645EJU5_9ZZZZ